VRFLAKMPRWLIDFAVGWPGQEPAAAHRSATLPQARASVVCGKPAGRQFRAGAAAVTP